MKTIITNVQQFLDLTGCTRETSKKNVDLFISMHEIDNDDLIADIYGSLGIDNEEKTTKAILIDAFEDYRFLNDYIYSSDVFDNNNFEDINELANYLYNRCNEIEIIYYSTAIELLAEHDQSLCDSLEIASEYGYTTEKLNSELLATLLIQSKVSEDITLFIEDVTELF